jgi:hypothetical protein
VIAIDRRVVQGPVVYCAFEGGGDYSTRAEAFRQRYLPEDTESLHFYLLDTQIDLVADHKEIIASIRSQVTDRRAPVCVVLDTLNRSLAGSESKDKDMAMCALPSGEIRVKSAVAAGLTGHLAQSLAGVPRHLVRPEFGVETCCCGSSRNLPQ